MHKTLILGIDIGGSYMRTLVWDGKRAYKRAKFETPKTLVELKRLLRSILANAERPNRRCVHIGIGIAGVVRGTKAIFCPNIPYIKNFDFCRYFPSDRVVRVDNDARAHARGERARGAHGNVRNALSVTLGTGIGRTLIRNGKIIYEKKLEFPEHWEARYQREKRKGIRSLALLLAQRLPPLLARYHTPVSIISGGSVKHTKHRIVAMINREWKKRGMPYRAVTARYKKYTGALGAALLLTKTGKEG